MLAEIFSKVKQTKQAEYFNVAKDYEIVHNNPNNVRLVVTIDFVKFGIITSKSVKPEVEEQLFDNYNDALVNLMQTFDSMSEADENDCSIVIVHGTEFHYINGEVRTEVLEWEVL